MIQDKTAKLALTNQSLPSVNVWFVAKWTNKYQSYQYKLALKWTKQIGTLFLLKATRTYTTCSGVN